MREAEGVRLVLGLREKPRPALCREGIGNLVLWLLAASFANGPVSGMSPGPECSGGAPRQPAPAIARQSSSHASSAGRHEELTSHGAPHTRECTSTSTSTSSICQKPPSLSACTNTPPPHTHTHTTTFPNSSIHLDINIQSRFLNIGIGNNAPF